VIAAALHRMLDSDAIRAGCARSARLAAAQAPDLAAQVEALLGIETGPPPSADHGI
jgi:hypothetical protein